MQVRGDRVQGSHESGAGGVYQVNADSDVAPGLSLGPLSKIPRAHKGHALPAWAHRPPRVVQKRLQHGLVLVVHHQNDLRWQAS